MKANSQKQRCLALRLLFYVTILSREEISVLLQAKPAVGK